MANSGASSGAAFVVSSAVGIVVTFGIARCRLLFQTWALSGFLELATDRNKHGFAALVGDVNRALAVDGAVIFAAGIFAFATFASIFVRFQETVRTAKRVAMSNKIVAVSFA